MHLMIRPIMPYDMPKLTENPFVLISGFVLFITAVLIAVVLSRYAAEAYKGDKKKATLFFAGITVFVTLMMFCFFGCAATAVKGCIFCLLLLFSSYEDIRVRECEDYVHLMIVIAAFIGTDMEALPNMILSALLVGGIKTVKDVLVVLRSVIAYTEKTTKVGLKHIEITYPKENKKEMRVLSSEEQRRFAAFLMVEPDVFKIGILISLVTGLRIGEICALRWRDVSFRDKTIRITSTMQRIKNTDQNAETKTKIVIKDPKSDASERVIPITEFGLSLFRMLYHPGCTANSFVLTCREDKYIEPRVLQYHMGVYCKECGLQDVHFHTLRHSFATRFVEIGCDIKSLSEILGHSNTKITLDRYVHSSLELKRANMMKLADIGY